MKTRVMQDEPDKAANGGPTPAGDERRRSMNVAARMGRWSAQHRKIAIFGWLAFVVVAFVLGMQIGTTQIDENTSGVGESGRADRILDAGFKRPASETVLIESETASINDLAFKAAVGDVMARVSRLEDVQNVQSPYVRGNEGQLAANGHAALVDLDIRGDSEDAMDKIGPVRTAVSAAQKAHPALFIGSFGVSGEKDVNDAFMDDLKKAGILSLPVTLIILLIVFGAAVAAGIPLLLALTAIFAAFGLVALPSSVIPIDQTTYEVMLLIGLAVGVDYSMFYLKREREERAAGRSAEAALQAAAATSGRSVLISGVTVIIAMSGMFFAGIQGMTAFGLGTIIVVAVAMLGSLTVLPALLSWLGDRVERGRVPLLGRVWRPDGNGRFWGAIVERVLRRPLLYAVLSGGLLVAIGIPALQLHTAQPGIDTFPQSLPSVITYNRIQAVYPGKELGAELVLKAPNVEAPRVQAAVRELERRAFATKLLHGPVDTDVNAAGTVADISIPIDGEGTDDASNASLTTLRKIVPGTVGSVPDTEVAVTGFTARSTDFNDRTKAVAPLVFGFVLLLALVLMLLAFRSIVIAVKAIVLNLLSVAAAYGVLVLVFQHGWGKGIIGFESTAGIDAFLPIFMFVILFGLSMDYHVFILSRIREAYDRGMSTDRAIAHGIKTTAGVVTSAAIVMVCVFLVFATLQMLVLKQFGIGLAAAILIDATVVRAVLLPATMKLLGDWNWYLPKWLEWIPHLEQERSAEPVVEAPPVPTPVA
jgi:uncharacterized membrane protein YdfJ with MMPL/SSD domain